MKHLRWQILLGSLLVFLSFLIYLIHYLVFKDVRHIFLWSFTSLGFLPISVLVVTLIINRLLSAREKRAKLEKLNMVIEAFFSEVGTILLERISACDPTLERIRSKLLVTKDWSKERFSRVSTELKSYNYKVEIKKANLEKLKCFLKEKRDFLLRLLENPNLLEHESFTELLRSVFHLIEELASRADLKQLPDNDYEHLAGDIRRAYRLLMQQWLAYMKYLLICYPYLFSLAMRTNPFDRDASPILK